MIAGETKVFKEGIVKKPDISLSMDSDTFIKLLNKELTGFDGLAQGKVKVTGNVADLLLIEKYLI
jgi:putative sterol carrier protein